MKRLLLVLLAALALPASALAWGGSYPTGDRYGSFVQIQVADSYTQDQVVPQDWATYLGTLVHGPELSKLTLNLVPQDSVQAVCGGQALACYDPGREAIYVSPEDQLDEPPAKEVIIHEYGHHIADNSDDAPWAALDYGTKRWSSYENICAKAVTGAASPGDEGSHYFQNSGEAFAEAYRVLNLEKEGDANIGWGIVARTFFPDATALTLLEQDITTPWTGPSASVLHGSFGSGAARTFGVKTQLDGTFTAHLVSPTKSRMRLALYDGSTVVSRGATVQYKICGQRSLTLKVERLSGRGAFSVQLTKP
ncbi:MAG: hypothetical protein ACJ77E_09835 [Gaiellaceae bacterium]